MGESTSRSVVVVGWLINTVVLTSWDKLLVISALAALLGSVASGTTADAEEPEKTSSHGESNSQPGGGKPRGVEVCLDVVGLLDGFDGCDDDGALNGGHQGGDKDGG